MTNSRRPSASIHDMWQLYEDSPESRAASRRQSTRLQTDALQQMLREERQGPRSGLLTLDVLRLSRRGSSVSRRASKLELSDASQQLTLSSSIVPDDEAPSWPTLLTTISLAAQKISGKSGKSNNRVGFDHREVVPGSETSLSSRKTLRKTLSQEVVDAVARSSETAHVNQANGCGGSVHAIGLSDPFRIQQAIHDSGDEASSCIEKYQRSKRRSNISCLSQSRRSTNSLEIRNSQDLFNHSARLRKERRFEILHRLESECSCLRNSGQGLVTEDFLGHATTQDVTLASLPESPSNRRSIARIRIDIADERRVSTVASDVMRKLSKHRLSIARERRGDLAVVSESEAPHLLPEIPRLRNMFRDNRQVLGGRWRSAALTQKQRLLQAAHACGLKECDWDQRLIYKLTPDDLQKIADDRRNAAIECAVLSIQRAWSQHILYREGWETRQLCTNAAIRIQRWWKFKITWVLPITWSAIRRKTEDKACARIQAAFRGWYTRKSTYRTRQVWHAMSQLEDIFSAFEEMKVCAVKILQGAFRRYIAPRRAASLPKDEIASASPVLQHSPPLGNRARPRAAGVLALPNLARRRSIQHVPLYHGRQSIIADVIALDFSLKRDLSSSCGKAIAEFPMESEDRSHPSRGVFLIPQVRRGRRKITPCTARMFGLRVSDSDLSNVRSRHKAREPSSSSCSDSDSGLSSASDNQPARL